MKRALWLMLALLPIAFTSCVKTIKTMTLTPTFGTRWFLKHGEATNSCWPAVCFHSHGLGCGIGDNAATEVQVGYEYTYNSGTGPCNCWWYRDCVFRGGVRFDLAPLQGKGVVAAQLKWTGRGSCAARLFVAGQPWNQFALSPANEIVSPWPPNSSGPGQLEVGITVRDWVKGNEPNHGWLFVGPDESFPNATWDQSDAEIGPANTGTHNCTSAVQGFTLMVQFTD